MTDTSKYPDRWERMHLAKLMEGRADCQVSGRWLQFPEVALENPNGAGTHALMTIDVMTADLDGKERKLCGLALAREDLLLILNRMPVAPLGSPLPPKTRPPHE